MKITTIIFDLGDVYLRGFRGIETNLEPFLDMPKEKIGVLLREGGALKKLFRGEITENTYWGDFVRKNKLGAPIENLKQVTRQHFQEIRGTRPIIEELKEKGYRLGLLSVHAREWIDHCEEAFDFHKLFHSRFYSFEAGICKPEREAYQIILERLATDPGETIFIDDLEKFIIPAKELGIHTILFKNPQQLRQELKKIGVNVKT